MPELAATVQSLLNASIDPTVAKALELEKEGKGKINWAAGVRCSFQHDEEHDQHGNVNIAVGPGLPLPVSLGGGFGFQQQIHDTNSVQVYFLFSSVNAPTIDPAPALPLPGVPLPGVPAVPDPGQPPDVVTADVVTPGA
jgi:hypothetical protein